MDQRATPDRPARGQGPGDSFPPSLEVNEPDVLDPDSWAEPEDTPASPLTTDGIEADEADLAEQARSVPDDEDGHDRDRGSEY